MINSKTKKVIIVRLLFMRFFLMKFVFCFVFAFVCVFRASGKDEFKSDILPQGQMMESSPAAFQEKVLPRIVVDIEEKIEGVKNEQSASDWISEKAVEYCIRIVNSSQSSAMSSKRAILLGRSNEAELRKEGIVSDCDYLIQGSVSGRQQKEKGLYGSKDGIKFSLGMNMAITEVATGTVIATSSIPSQNILIRNVDSSQAASREAVRRLMAGKGQEKGAAELFQKMEEHWAKESSSGEIYRMEFNGLNMEQANLLRKALSSLSSVADVKVRSIDAAGVSVLECRSKLSSLDLAAYIEKHLTGTYLDRSDSHYLSFIINNKPVEAMPPVKGEVYAWIKWVGLSTIIFIISLFFKGVRKILVLIKHLFYDILGDVRAASVAQVFGLVCSGLSSVYSHVKSILSKDE